MDKHDDKDSVVFMPNKPKNIKVIPFIMAFLHLSFSVGVGYPFKFTVDEAAEIGDDVKLDHLYEEGGQSKESLIKK